MTDRRKFIIDTDTAGDDTTAILTTLHNFEVLGVTIAGGNVSFDQEVENALYTIELSNQDYYVPVFKGHEEPIMQLADSKHYTEERIFADDGMGNSNFDKAKQRPEEQHAVDFIIETIKENPGEVEILAIAPLTNIAQAIKREPSITKDIKHLWIMGGINNAVGNIKATAEYNFYTDPEAAKIVLHSETDMTMVTWDMCLAHAVMYDDDIEDIRQLNTKGSQFFLDVNMHVKEFEFKKRGVDGITCPDSVVAAIAADESLVLKSSRYYVDIELNGELTRGHNIVDIEGDLEKTPNILVVEEIDDLGFKNHLMEVLKAID